MKLQRIAIPALALGGAAMLLVPGGEAIGYTTLGGALGVNQRDFRVHDNFLDPQTNDNTTPDAQFPGWTGAEMAIWKACVEWGSGPHGNGSGDPLQSNLGDGGANFDPYWAGATDGIGNPDDNIHSSISSCGGGGTLAYTETPISDGWRIRYCDEWTWHDGPGDNFSGFDLQGVACHEYGHALGLGHSSSFSATMYPSTSGSGSSNQRSIASDDEAGVQAVYGVALTSFKPRITGVTVNGNQVTITGVNLPDTDGQVWFTNKNVTGFFENPRVRLEGVQATNGGTVLTVTIPPDAGRGDLLVKRTLDAHSSISNAFPFDGEGTGVPLSISGISPSTVENLIPGTAQTVTITGAGFTPASTIELDGTPIAGASTWIDPGTMTFEWEPSTLGLHTITVLESGQSDSVGLDVVANALPALQAGNGDPANVVTGSVELTMAGQPGALHYVMLSPSNVPSVLPGKISLGLGNVFQLISEVGVFLLDANGLATTSLPLVNVSNTSLYWQSLDLHLPLAANYPLQESNLQETFTP